jgi:hypothetical protein
MTRAMYDIIVDYVLFLETSGDDVLNPDVAVKKLEDLALQIGNMDSETRAALVHYARNHRANSVGEREALSGFFRGIGG